MSLLSTKRLHLEDIIPIFAISISVRRGEHGLKVANKFFLKILLGGMIWNEFEACFFTVHQDLCGFALVNEKTFGVSTRFVGWRIGKSKNPDFSGAEVI